MKPSGQSTGGTIELASIALDYCRTVLDRRSAPPSTKLTVIPRNGERNSTAVTQLIITGTGSIGWRLGTFVEIVPKRQDSDRFQRRP